MARFSIGAFAGGFGAGACIGVAATALVLRKVYRKKFEQWQADFVATRVDLERSRRLRMSEETPEPTEQKKVEAKPLTTYEDAMERYSPDSDNEEHHKMDKDGDEEDDEDEEAKYEGPSEGPYKMNDDDVAEAIRMIEEDGKSLDIVAYSFGVTRPSLQILIAEAKAAKANGKRPTKWDVPYIITFDQYETERLEYEKVDLEFYREDNEIYYSDPTWDERNQLVEVGRYLGPKKNLYHDKEDSERRIYIRNDKEQTDFRILCFD